MSEQNGKISLQDAIDWTTNWRRTPASTTNAFLIPLADLQGAIAEIQSQPGSPMIRAYMAEKDGEEKLVIVGTSQQTQKDGSIVYKDLLPADNENFETATNGIWDFTQRCPPHCDPNSKLNS